MNTGIHKIWFAITEKGSVYFITKNIGVTPVFVIIPRLRKPIKRGKIKKAIKKKNFDLVLRICTEGWNFKELEI